MALSPSKILLRLQELQKWQTEHLKKDVSEQSSAPFSEQVPTTNSGPPKPKQSYLRKGAGLERFKMKPLPLKQKQQPLRATKPPAPILSAPNLKLEKPRPTWSDCLNKPVTDSYIDREIEEKTKKIQAIDEIVRNSDEIGDQTLELLLFEALEEKVGQSSFCSTNSSVVHMLESTPNKIKRILTTEFSDEEKWSTSSESSVEPASELETTLQTEGKIVEKCDATTQSESAQCQKCLEQQEIIDQKTSELLKLRQEFRKELQQKNDQFQREFCKKEKEFDEEKRVLNFEINELKAKMNKEKTVFEMYLKDSQQRPSKKEREEIQNLKQELADLKELLKLKETKNGTTQARLRNQIKQLEKENNKLKEENEKLTTDNAKLSASQKLNQNRKTTDTKILHKISENLTKLTKECHNENLDLTKFRNLSIEKEYENTFKTLKQQTLNDSGNKNLEKNEEILSDGSKLIKYSNGNIKTISRDGNLIKLKYFNGDLKETNLIEGAIKYFYNDQKIWTTSNADGTEFVEFANGQKETRFKDGRCEIRFPDGLVQITHPDGKEEVKYPDGSFLTILNGEKILNLPNGQKEIHSNDYKRREYPDGTIKILYNDGTQETRYANGRVRIKDANGVLILDNCDNN